MILLSVSSYSSIEDELKYGKYTHMIVTSMFLLLTIRITDNLLSSWGISFIVQCFNFRHTNPTPPKGLPMSISSAGTLDFKLHHRSCSLNMLFFSYNSDGFNQCSHRNNMSHSFCSKCST